MNFHNNELLVYADYLEEQGDSQGELIRVQIEIINRYSSGLPVETLIIREKQLLTEIKSRFPKNIEFYKGLPYYLTAFRRSDLDCLKIYPTIKHVKVVNRFSDKVVKKLTKIPNNITTLDVSSTYFTNYNLHLLLKSPYFWLTNLDISITQVDASGIISLTNSTNGKKLKNLKISNINAIVNIAKNMINLEILTIRNNSLKLEDARLLANMKNLLILDLRNCGIKKDELVSDKVIL